MAIITTDVVAEYGAYYRAEGQGLKDLFRLFTQRSATEQYFSDFRVTEKTKIEKATAEITRVLQRFQKAWTPIGNTTFKIEPIELKKWKIDVQETPDDLEESWLGFLASNDLDRTKWPFVRYWIEELILKQAEHDWEMNEVFAGVLGTVTPGTATGAGSTINGINKVINDWITAGRTAPLVTGAVPTDPVAFVNYIETFVKEIPKVLLPSLEPIRMSQELGQRYMDGMELKYNTNYERASNLIKVHNMPVTIATQTVETNGEKFTIPGLPSHNGSEKIWTTLKGNSVLAKKKPGNETAMKVENVDRTVKVYTDAYRGLGFWIPEYILVNDK